MNQELSAAALSRYAELMALQAEGLDYPDGSVEAVTADILLEGDVIRTPDYDSAEWGQIVGATYYRAGVDWEVRLLRTDETVLVHTSHAAKVDRLAVEW